MKTIGCAAPGAAASFAVSPAPSTSQRSPARGLARPVAIAEAPPTARRRIASVDFWRGMVLLFILVNHTPYSLFGYLTPRNYGFSDSAEAFVFLSGFAVATAYWPRLVAGDAPGVIWRCLRRALQLYGVQVLLSAAAVAMFGLAHLLGGPADLIQNVLFFFEPVPAAIGMLTLGHQLGFFNILPLYIVLMLLAGLILPLLRRSLWLGLGASAALYALARLGLAMPSWPEPDTWFFNPFAWQLVFTLGMICGILAHSTGVPFRRPMLVAACLVLAASALAITSVFGLVPAAAEWGWTYLDAGKFDLGLVRLVHFAALAYALAHLRLGEAALRLPGAGEIARLGRYSLPVFAAGSLISTFGQIVAAILVSREAALATLNAAGVSVAIGGAAALFLLARWLERRSLTSRAAHRSLRATSATPARTAPLSPLADAGAAAAA